MSDETRRREWVETHFDHDVERQALQHRELNLILDTQPVRAGGTPSVLEYAPRALPSRFRLPPAMALYLSVPPLAIDRDQLLDLLGTRGLLVLHDDRIVYEEYRHGHDQDTRWMANAATKLVIAMLVARAEAEGALSVDEPVETYWPEADGTSWTGVTVGQCLAMTTGIDFVEESLDLMDPDNQFRDLFHEVAFGSVERFLLSLSLRAEPGTQLVYSSIDTEALASVLPRAVGRGLASYLEQSVWQPAGMEADAAWACDTTGRVLGLTGLCATLRDYGRLGLVLQHDGHWNGEQILPAAFPDALRQPDPAVFELPGHDDYPLLSWQQVLIPSSPDDQAGDYLAAGSYGQLVYVNPERRVVVAHQGIGRDITTDYLDQHRALMAFRQIADALG